MPANNYGGKPIPAGAESAAQLIWDAAQKYSISPKVLLTTIQKESVGPLTTDDWPFYSQYQHPLGANCPDSGPNGSANCDPNYYGFSMQINQAAALFRYYLDNMSQSWWTYKKPFATNSILWNVSSTGCGAANVYIQSKATAALYTYTPYQPNQAALNNLYGTGDGCSSYGNRNFWRIFTDWFGSTQTNIPYAWTLVSQEAYVDSAYSTGFTNGISIAPGGKAYLRVKAHNNGYQTWDQSVVKLGTSAPHDRSSAFSDDSWLSSTRIQLEEPSVLPGDVGTFDFSITAPTQPGTYTEYFNPVAENITWMNDFGFGYTIDVVNPATSNGQQTVLASGASLSAGQHMLSPDTQSTLNMQTDGNVVLYGDHRALWANGIMDNRATRLIMQSDGNLVEYNGDTPLWASGTAGNPGAYLALQWDGNLVLYTAGGTPLWASGTVSIPDHYKRVNRYLPIGFLFQNQTLQTANRSYRLILQDDSNLVLYNGTHAIWASNTVGTGASYLSMQPDGNLVMYTSSNKAVWATNTVGRGGISLLIQPDGNLVMYTSVNKAVWASNTVGK
jgi:hypothetical protein